MDNSITMNLINKKIELEITGMTHQGFRVGKYNDFPFFVPFALKGEKIICAVEKVNKNHGYGNLVKIITPSPHRVAPRCAIFGICGGCDIMHIEYQQQLKLKEEIALDTFKK